MTVDYIDLLHLLYSYLCYVSTYLTDVRYVPAISHSRGPRVSLERKPMVGG